jgi:L-fuculose-phosphate aldolase
MRPVVTTHQIEELLRAGGDLDSLPADAIYTPSALDLIADVRARAARASIASVAGAGFSRPSEASRSAAAPVARLNSKSPKADLDALFTSDYARTVKEQMCDVGRRLWQREYVDGNGGNIAVRVGEDLAICTPTLVSKGFMKPDDMCLVDFQGNQLAGTKARTSEILMHLQIMARQPKAAATVHCHPPYATGFAVVGIEPPTCLIPEYEVFASVALAPYRTPGTPEMGKFVADLVEHHNIVLMANHGVVSWSPTTVEDAYMKMEILEAYCRTVLVTAQLGKPPNTFTPEQMRDLLRIKQSLNIPDPRHGLKEAELCDNSDWNPGTRCAMPASSRSAGSSSSTSDADVEKLIQEITDKIMGHLS